MRDPNKVERTEEDHTVEESVSFEDRGYEGEKFKRRISKNTYVPPKPCSRGFGKFFRNYAKGFYKRSKTKERKIGRKINELMQELHHESKFRDKGDEDKEYLKRLMKELIELRQTPRFIKEFPSFAVFFNYIRKEGMSYNDLKELDDGRRDS